MRIQVTNTLPDSTSIHWHGLILLFDQDGLGSALADRGAWGEMRMMPTDNEDVQGFTPLINGNWPDRNWIWSRTVNSTPT